MDGTISSDLETWYGAIGLANNFFHGSPLVFPAVLYSTDVVSSEEKPLTFLLFIFPAGVSNPTYIRKHQCPTYSGVQQA